MGRRRCRESSSSRRRIGRTRTRRDPGQCARRSLGPLQADTSDHADRIRVWFPTRSATASLKAWRSREAMSLDFNLRIRRCAQKWIGRTQGDALRSSGELGMLFNPNTAPAGGWAYVAMLKRPAHLACKPSPYLPSVRTKSNVALDQFGREPNGGLDRNSGCFQHLPMPRLIVNCAARDRVAGRVPVSIVRDCRRPDLLRRSEQLLSIGKRRHMSIASCKGEKPADLPVQAPTGSSW